MYAYTDPLSSKLYVGNGLRRFFQRKRWHVACMTRMGSNNTQRVHRYRRRNKAMVWSCVPIMALRNTHDDELSVFEPDMLKTHRPSVNYLLIRAFIKDNEDKTMVVNDDS